MTYHDISGVRFGRLVAKERVDKKWRCACDCGAEKLINPSNMKRGLTKSCGCLSRQLTGARNTALLSKHRMSKSGEYKTWQGMHQRCGNRTDKSFNNYGGRGIRVCERWGSFDFFFADMGNRPDGASLDRINVDGDYEPENCRWATAKQQQRNKRNSLIVVIDGKRSCLADFIKQGTHSREYQAARKLVKRGLNPCP